MHRAQRITPRCVMGGHDALAALRAKPVEHVEPEPGYQRLTDDELRSLAKDIGLKILDGQYPQYPVQLSSLESKVYPCEIVGIRQADEGVGETYFLCQILGTWGKYGVSPGQICKPLS